MLSMSGVSGGQAASGYYKAEGYYISGSSEAEQTAQYFGKAAEEAGLSGRVDDARFSELLEGHAPDGTKIGRMRDGAWEHRPGLDLTFSAPKGVSIAGLVGEDARVIEAHREAVRETLTYVENHIVQTRTGSEQTREIHTGGKIIAGLFQHDTSRALDPQLHTHAVIVNMVQGDDGKFRALHNDRIWQSTKLLGQIYRSALASKLQDLGYSIEWKEQGLFDIKDVPDHVVEHFSKRRAEIEASLKDRDLEPNAKNSALAALATRSSKGAIERAKLYEAWKTETRSLGYSFDAPQQRDAPALSPQSAKDALAFAISHLSERNSVYPRSDVVQTALRHSPRVSARDIEREIRDGLAARALFTVAGEKEPHLTDRETARLERETIGLMRRGRNGSEVDVRTVADKMTLRAAENVVGRRLERGSSLTDGQKDAALLLLTSPDRVVGVQGLAGTGKTYMLSTVAKQLEKAGYTVEGLAPSLKAVSALSEAVPDSRTVESALVRHSNAPSTGDRQKVVLFIDEASMVSTRQMNSLLKMAEVRGYARVALVGDVRQLDSVAAGSSFRQLQKAGMPTATMVDIQRQHSEEGRAAVLAAYKGDVHRAFEGVREVRITDDDRGAIADQVAKSYLERGPEDQQRTGVIVMTNAMRRDINAAIQSGLRQSGAVTGSAVTLNTLTPRGFTRAEAGEISSYVAGDVVAALKTFKTENLTAGALYTVTGVDIEARALSLTDTEGATRTITLSAVSRMGRYLVSYAPTHESFAKGDAVKFKITDRAQGIENANTGKIVSVDQQALTVRTEDGDKTLPTDSLAVRGMQLAYAATAHDFQGSTVDRVILGMHSLERLATQKAFYVGLSRMREDTLLVTDDVQRLSGRIADQTGERVNALEALAENRQPFQERDRNRSEDPAKSRDQKASEEPSRERDQKATEELRREVERLVGDEKEQARFEDRLRAIVEELPQKHLDQKTM